MLELYFEHRNYVPLVGIVLAVALALARMEPGQRKRLAYGLVGLWLVACAITTALSARIYTSQDRLALTWASAQPDSIRAQSYLAQRLVVHHQLQKALDVINDAARHHPEDSMLAENRVYLRCMEGKLTPADIQRLDAILRAAPFDSGGFNNMETLRKLAFGGQCPALNPNNWLHLTDTLLANPAYGHNGIAAGFLHYQRHFWAVSKGNLDMAIRELDKTYQFDPDAEIPRLEAKYLASAGLYDQAIAALRDTDYPAPAPSATPAGGRPRHQPGRHPPDPGDETQDRSMPALRPDRHPPQARHSPDGIDAVLGEARLLRSP